MGRSRTRVANSEKDAILWRIKHGFGAASTTGKTKYNPASVEQERLPTIPAGPQSPPALTRRSTSMLPALTARPDGPAKSSRKTEAARIEQMYANRANDFYLKALALASPRALPPADDAPPPAAEDGNGRRGLRRAIGRVIDGKRPRWDKALHNLKKVDSQQWDLLRKRFHKFTKDALHAEEALVATLLAQSEALEKRNAIMTARQEARILMRRRSSMRSPSPEVQAKETLRAKVDSVLQTSGRPERTNPAWGGVGWRYSVADGEDAKLRRGRQQEQQLGEMATAFDQRQESFAGGAQRLLEGKGHRLADSDVQRRAMDKCLFGLRANRWTQQPLRLASNVLSPRIGHASDEYAKPLAVAGSSGNGPLVPVYERQFETDVYVDEEPEPEPEVRWTLYASIWGPRCEDSDGLDFVDHEEVIFERFISDWQSMLRLGLGKMIVKNDDDGAMDEDEDGVPDEVEDVGAVMLMNNHLCTLAWTMYSDAVYGGSGSLDIGCKLNQGWKAFTDECGIWSHKSEKDATCANSLIFIEVDRIDRETSAAIALQATFRGHQVRREHSFGFVAADYNDQAEMDQDAKAADAVEAQMAHYDGIGAASRAAMDLISDPVKDFKKKTDNQLNRVEFMVALVKMAIERFIRSKELTDVSDAVECLFVEFIQPALAVPLAGCEQPRVPLPDSFRQQHCYTRQMSEQLEAHAPSLRVIFAGLARLTFEAARTVGVKMPKATKNERVHQRGAKWIKVPGYVSYAFWRRFIEALFPPSVLELRKTTLCFQYSQMVVIDGSSGDGRLKDRNLPFEGFLEAIVRMATWLPLPTDELIASVGSTKAKYKHAGPWIAALEQREDPESLLALKANQACEWGSVPPEKTAGDMPQRLRHLGDVLVHKIRQPKPEEETKAPLASLTRPEFRRWALANMPEAHDYALSERWSEQKLIGESLASAHLRHAS